MIKLPTPEAKPYLCYLFLWCPITQKPGMGVTCSDMGVCTENRDGCFKLDRLLVALGGNGRSGSSYFHVPGNGEMLVVGQCMSALLH